MTNSLIPKDGFSKAVVIATISTLFLFMVSTQSFQAVHAQKEVGTVRVITHVINSHGGTKQASDFSSCIDSSRGGATSKSCSSGDETGSSENSFNPGPYKVTQSSPVVGYSVAYSSDCSGYISAGESKVCTVTYSDLPSPTQTTSQNSTG
ncbi:MAG: hypothetical protein JO327_01595 [Nitrososphaeraceae archaeon]|nr:hypothetical protein [Nitrososphaeraceae archaeon]